MMTAEEMRAGSVVSPGTVALATMTAAIPALMASEMGVDRLGEGSSTEVSPRVRLGCLGGSAGAGKCLATGITPAARSPAANDNAS